MSRQWSFVKFPLLERIIQTRKVLDHGDPALPGLFLFAQAQSIFYYKTMGKKIYAPWRENYILAPGEKGCLFCRIAKENEDKKNYVLYRGRRVFVVLNRYPYVSGHLMIVPYRHIAHLERLPEATALELIRETQRAIKILKMVLTPDSLNIGINLGYQSGAGVPGHLHQHLVPRWQGDTNFLSVIGDVRVISVSLPGVFRRLSKAFREISL